MIKNNSTKNVMYGIECTLCGLLYVGETRQTLPSRMSQHRYDAKILIEQAEQATQEAVRWKKVADNTRKSHNTP
jgi:hypothetical protein